MPLSAREVDRLGERIKAGEITDEDRHLLEEFRVSYLPAYREVVGRIRELSGVNPSGRPEKRLESIVAKLQRGETSLSQMQDIAGCRIVTENRRQQDAVVHELVEAFERTRVVDRRLKPRHGYRAVHVIVRAQERPVEVQVRTVLQDLWANLTESWESYGGDLKHGREPPGLKGVLDMMINAGDVVAQVEERGVAWRPRGRGPIPRSEWLHYQVGLLQGTVWAAWYFQSRTKVRE